MKSSKAFLATALVMLSMAAGCARQTGIPGDESASGQHQKLPFDRSAPDAGISPSGSPPGAGKIPAGTPVTVRLRNTMSSASAHDGDIFDAVLDEPIVFDGQTIVNRGTALKGRVLAARTSGRTQDAGYLRVALVSIMVGGKPLPLQTSSIFAKGGAHQRRNLAMMGGGAGAGALINGPADGGKESLIGTGAGAAHSTGKKEVSLTTEHRLTFRLAQPADLHPQN